MNRIITDVTGLSVQSKIYLFALTAIAGILPIMWGDPWYGVLTSMAGAMCVVLVAEGKISNFMWGMINCIGYGAIAYMNNIQGDMLLNWAVYVPFQIIGLIMWSLPKSQRMGRLETKKLGVFHLIGVAIVIALAIIATEYTLIKMGSSKTFWDAANVVLSLAATALMALRYREQWICWILVNLSGIFLWTQVAMDPNQHAAVTGLAMWVVFLINSVYGLVRWSKTAK